MTDIVPDPRAIAYWCRGATTGSTLVALCAGKQHAAKPASVTTATTVPRVAGSRGDSTRSKVELEAELDHAG
jgi:hypothetical protein